MTFTDRESTREHARQHSQLMDQLYSAQSNDSYARTVMYGVDATIPTSINSNAVPSIEIVNQTTVDAIMQTDNQEKSMVLDFASYTYPGEKYAAGDYAQEESLFHHSNLYEVLTLFVDSYYAYNRDNKNNSLYLDRALYIPDIVFEDTDKRQCDVIVCSAPNYRSAAKHYAVDAWTNHCALRDRIKFIKAVAESNLPDTLILGSWGTGIFNQNVVEVANTFRQVFKHSPIKKLVYAIPDEDAFKLFNEVYEV